MSHWQKSPDGFTRLGNCLEARFDALGPGVTPPEAFFVCNAGDSLAIDPDHYRLKIRGDAVDRVVTLGLKDLQDLPQHDVTAFVECAGNQRTLFAKVNGHDIARDSQGEDVPWTLGGIGMGHWSGPRLKDVLALAGVGDDAAWVAPMGLDVLNPECDIEIPMPIDKALHPDTLIALRMNGAPLPADHGAPARMIVPGWVGTYWVKWVGWLTVSSREIRNFRTDEYYVLDGQTVTEQNLKSSLCLPFPAWLGAGPQHIRGIARSPGKGIAKVEWRLDDGPWAEAQLDPSAGRWGWSAFHFDWDATPGAHHLSTRAWDNTGATQPAHVAMNEGTLLYNAIIPHPVRVT